MTVKAYQAKVSGMVARYIEHQYPEEAHVRLTKFKDCGCHLEVEYVYIDIHGFDQASTMSINMWEVMAFLFDQGILHER